MNNKYLKDHPQTKKIVRLIGFLATAAGLILMVISISDFFASMGTFDMPDKFGLGFIGMPLLFVGIVCLSFGYMKEVGEYTASQTAPVAKDVTNYMLDGTREEVVKTIQKVVGSIKESSQGKVCYQCQTQNEVEAKFCDHCGARLIKECRYCHEENDGNARYCRDCGKEL